MAENKEEILIRLKYGLTFSKLLTAVKKQKIREGNKSKGKNSLNASLGKISSDTGLRVATLSEIFSGKSNPKAKSISLILSALGKTMTDFGKVYDKISESDVLKYKESLGNSKSSIKKNLQKSKTEKLKK